jgi:ATP-binding cassette, subfamily C, bacterial CydC
VTHGASLGWLTRLRVRVLTASPAVPLAALLAACLLASARVGAADAIMIALIGAGLLQVVTVLPAAVAAAGGAGAAERRMAAAGPMQPGPPRGVAPTPGADPAAPGSGRGAASAPDADSTSPAGLPVVVSRLALPSPLPRPSGLSLALAAGRVLIVSGRSGSGKTTVLRALAGEVATAGAAVLAGGVPPREQPAGQIVLVAHDDYLFPGSVWDNFRAADPGISEPDAEKLLADFGLAQRGITAATVLGGGGRDVSGGEARRLCLARATAKRPRLLLLDEPTEGLDVATAAMVWYRIRSLLPGATIVAAVHDQDLPSTDGLDAGRLCLDHAEIPLAES